MRAHLVPGACNQTIEIGGPQDLSPLDVIQIFERVSETPFERQFVPQEALLARKNQAADPLSESFANLELECAHGCVMDSSPALALMPMELATVENYATSVCGQAVQAS